MQVKNSLKRNLRSADDIFWEKKTEKKIACIETESVTNKMKFFR